MITDEKEKLFCEINALSDEIDKMNSSWIERVDPHILSGVALIICGISCIIAALGYPDALLYAIITSALSMLVALYGVVHCNKIIKLIEKKIRLLRQLYSDDLL